MAKIYFDIGEYTVEVSTHGWFHVYSEPSCDNRIYVGMVEELGLDYSRRCDDIGTILGFTPITLKDTKTLCEGWIKAGGIA